MTENQFQRKIFLDDTGALLTNLKEWTAKNGVTLTTPEEGWPKGESIRLSKGGLWVEIEAKRPEELNTETKIDGAWGLCIRDSVSGTRRFLARWPSGWRTYNEIKHDWNKDQIDVGGHLETLLSGFLGLPRGK
jgi:hypothetical protein